MPVCDEKKVVFLHIPKTGGTTIRKLLGIHQLVDENPETIPSPQHLTCRLLRDRLGSRFDRYYKFTFIRNPWARAVSDFAWRQFLPEPWKAQTFDQFLEHASAVIESGDFYRRPFDDHFIPQVHFSSEADEIFRYEAFCSNVRKVAGRLGLEIDRIPARRSAARDAYWTFYDDRSKALIADYYRADIEAFGYEFENGAQA